MIKIRGFKSGLIAVLVSAMLFSFSNITTVYADDPAGGTDPAGGGTTPNSAEVVLDDPSDSTDNPTWYYDKSTGEVTFKYTGAKVILPSGDSRSDSKFNAMTVSVNEGSIKNPTTEAHKWTVTDIIKDDKGNDAHRTATWQFSGGKSANDVEEILKSLSFVYEKGISVSVTLSESETNIPTGGTAITTFEIDGKPHYYMYVPFESGDANKKNWIESYKLAKSYTFMGMKGYLATVMSKEEDQVLDNITTKGAWAGGARVQVETVGGDEPNIPNDEDEPIFTIIADQTHSAQSEWMWVCGPECRTLIDVTGGTCVPDKDGNFPKDAEGKMPGRERAIINPKLDSSITADISTYSNWNQPKAVASEKEPNNTSNNEWWLQVHYTSGNETEGYSVGWNDLGPGTYKMNNYVEGYFVEFSGYNAASAVKVEKEDVPQYTHIWDKTPESEVDPKEPENAVTIKCIATNHDSCPYKDDEGKLTLTLGAVNASDKTYNGLGKEFKITTDDILGCTTAELFKSGTNITLENVEYSLSSGSDYSTDKPIKAGTYNIRADVKLSGTVLKQLITSLTIAPKDLTVTLGNQEVFVHEDVNKTIYKDDELDTDIITVEGLADGDKVYSADITGDTSTVTPETGNDRKVTLGTGGIKIVNSEDEDVTSSYNIAVTDGILTVKKIDIKDAVLVDPGLSIEYGTTLGTLEGDDSSGASASVTLNGKTIEGKLTFKNSEDRTKTPKTTKDGATPATYDFVFTPTNPGYTTTEFTVPVTVTPKTIELTWDPTDPSYTYNGSGQAPDADFASGSIVSGDEGEVSLETTITYKDGTALPAGTTDSIDAGDYKITATLTGDEAYNYVIKSGQNAKEYTIAKKKITAEWTSDSPYTYNGENQNPTAVIKDGIESTDEGKVTLDVKFYDKDDQELPDGSKNVGDYKAKASLNGDRANNYVLDDTTFDITKDYKITGKDIDNDNTEVTITKLDEDGKPVIKVVDKDMTPEVELTDDDYTVTEAKYNETEQKWEVTITGDGNYTGEKKVKVDGDAPPKPTPTPSPKPTPTKAPDPEPTQEPSDPGNSGNSGSTPQPTAPPVSIIPIAPMPTITTPAAPVQSGGTGGSAKPSGNQVSGDATRVVSPNTGEDRSISSIFIAMGLFVLAIGCVIIWRQKSERSERP